MSNRCRAKLVMAENITAADLNAALDRQTALLNAALDKQTVNTISQIDSRLSKVRLELIEEINSVKFSSKAATDINSKEIENIKKRLDTQDNQNLHVAIDANDAEQRRRALSVKAFNFQVLKGLDHQREVFKTFIAPAYTLAVAAGDLNRVPEFVECMEYGHVLKSFSMDREASIVCKFTTRNYKKIWRDHSNAIIDAYNAKMEAAWKNPTKYLPVRLGNDLTMDNRRVMSALYEDKERVAKVRLGKTVQFQLKASPTIWRTVHNPFTTDLYEMQQEIKSCVGNQLMK